MLHRKIEEAKLVASLKRFLKSFVLSSWCVECAVKGSSRLAKPKVWQALFSNLYFFRCILALGSRLDNLFACVVVLAHGCNHWELPTPHMFCLFDLFTCIEVHIDARQEHLILYAYLTCLHTWRCLHSDARVNHPLSI